MNNIEYIYTDYSLINFNEYLFLSDNSLDKLERDIINDITTDANDKQDIEQAKEYLTNNDIEIDETTIRNAITNNRIYQKCELNHINFFSEIYDFYKENVDLRDFFFRNLYKIVSESIQFYKEKLKSCPSEHGDDKSIVIMPRLLKALIEYNYLLFEYVKNSFKGVDAVRELYITDETIVKDITSRVSLKNIGNYSSTIFRSQKAEEWFFDTLEYIGKNYGEWGFSAVLDAIYQDEDCENHIFKPAINLEKYVDYINEKYKGAGEPLSNQKLSTGKRYATVVDLKIKEFIKENKLME